MILKGDALTVLNQIPDGKIQTCITSPPYFGLRDYGENTLTIWDEDKNCDHVWGPEIIKKTRGVPAGKTAQVRNTIKGVSGTELKQGQYCSKCGAWFGQLGLEPTIGEYTGHLVQIFREVKRVLRDDGTLWLVIGDSYTGQPGSPGLKTKDLCEIPSEVAMALREDGWYLRSRIPWIKFNAMPESVKDRPTSAVEYIFLFSKRNKYYYDHISVKMPLADTMESGKKYDEETGRNRRNSDWFMESIQSGVLIHDDEGLPMAICCNTFPFKEAHFAVFPENLIEPMILASTSPKVCEKCGGPWKREVVRRRIARNELSPDDPRYRPNTYEGAYADINGKGDAGYSETKTIGWRPSCTCKQEGKGKGLVLDPFLGSGTTALVAEKLGRNWVGAEISDKYIDIAGKRIKGAVV